MLTKEQIMSASDLQTETVNVPEWGGDVTIKTMTGFQRDQFEQSVVDGKKTNLANIRARFCSMIIVGEDGKPMFTDDDVVFLGRKSGKALGRIFDAGQKLNGMTKEDFEELEKNSGKTQTEDIISD